MCMIRKFFVAVISVAFIISVTTTAFAEENIDWEQGVYRNVGFAIGPNGENFKIPFYRIYAKQAARCDALRNIAEVVWGASVTEIAKEHFILEAEEHSDESMRIIVDNAKLVNSRYFTDNSCEVTMELPLFGKNSYAAAIFSNVQRSARQSFPQPVTAIKLDDTKYTGLIVDCRGFKLAKDVKVSIANTNDTVIYSRNHLNLKRVFNKVVNSGMVEYVEDIDKQTRAGKNPLIVKAVQMKNGVINVSVEDSDKILTANKKFKFLDNCNVVFIY